MGLSVRSLCEIIENLKSEISLYDKKLEKDQVKPKVSERKKITSREEISN